MSCLRYKLYAIYCHDIVKCNYRISVVDFFPCYIAKHLMCALSGNSEFCFLSMFPSTSSRETLRLSGKQNSLFPSGAHIKCILILWLLSILSEATLAITVQK